MDRYDWRDIVASPALDEIERAVAAREPVLLVGPPGTGKTMVSRRIPTIMPPLSEHARTWLALDRAEYASDRRSANAPIERPFRAPHYTISKVAMRGEPGRWGQAYDVACRPIKGERTYHPARLGELDLARFGVLFLDELVEFDRPVVEAVAERLAALRGSEACPYLVASTNPCPCGWRDSGVRECSCLGASITRYNARLATYCDLLGLRVHVTMPAITLDTLRERPHAEPSAVVRERVTAARASSTEGR